LEEDFSSIINLKSANSSNLESPLLTNIINIKKHRHHTMAKQKTLAS
jgi:hypothetical protein